MEHQFFLSCQPIRICVLGPPAVGKSTISQHISKYFKLHHIKLKETISQTMSQLVSTSQSTTKVEK